MKLPLEFESNMRNLLGKDFDNYIESLNEQPKKGMRVNANYITSQDFDKVSNIDARKIVGLDNYYQIFDEKRVGNTAFHHAGMIYIQEPSSMLPALALDVKEGETCLDLCSAPGGKAGQILENNKTGIVVLNEIVRQRANILYSNIERQGYKNALITCLSPQKLSQSLANCFDKILVDAPCSGEGMFRKDNGTIEEWNSGLPEFNHQRQMEILDSADKMLKQGGVLVYSTCTFNLEENEKTVLEFSEKYGYKIDKVPSIVERYTSKGLLNGAENARHCFPHNGFGEGQFICRLIKISENNYDCYTKKTYQSVNRQDKIVADSFIKECINKSLTTIKVGDNICAVEQDFPYIPDGVVNIGVRLGCVEKGRIVPNHQFFKAYGKEFVSKVCLNIEDARVYDYMYGNQIEVDGLKNGYACVLVENVPLGGGKVVGNVLKNHYPKGLRTNKVEKL